ncbi:carboxypeptidase-like regulatory domain-containing protein [Salegentibacter sp. HM20]
MCLNIDYNFMNNCQILCLLFSLPLFSQNSGIRGSVTTAGEPLELVSIVVEQSNRGTTTGEGGTYILDNLPPESYIIKAISL